MRGKQMLWWVGLPALVAELAIACRVGDAEPDRTSGEVAVQAVAEPRQEPQGSRKAAPFADNAFPPTIPDSASHANAWMENDCLRCHETGVFDAPRIMHEDLPPILRTAKCRTCHVLIPGSRPRPLPAVASPFESSAFPPMIPASSSHKQTWLRDDCLLCHDSGLRGAPRVRHEGLPQLLLVSKCRTCHVQVRAVEATRPFR